MQTNSQQQIVITKLQEFKNSTQPSLISSSNVYFFTEKSSLLVATQPVELNKKAVKS